VSRSAGADDLGQAVEHLSTMAPVNAPPMVDCDRNRIAFLGDGFIDCFTDGGGDKTFRIGAVQHLLARFVQCIRRSFIYRRGRLLRGMWAIRRSGMLWVNRIVQQSIGSHP
jgi:hypothetical protein